MLGLIPMMMQAQRAGNDLVHLANKINNDLLEANMKVVTLQTSLAIAEEALRWYANAQYDDSGIGEVNCERGTRAREALIKMGAECRVTV